MVDEECEENRQFKRDLKLLDKLNNTQHVIPKNYLCRIGHDLHGHFDPQHVDFEILCGIVHTERAAIFFPYLSGSFLVLSTIFLVVTEMYYFLPLMGINVPFVILLRYAIIKRDHRKMLPFLIFVLIEQVFWIITIVACCVIVFMPHLPVYTFLSNVIHSNIKDFQLVVLLIVLLFSIDFFVMAYINWNILFHYVYLMHCNTNACCHTHECPGRADVDPRFHRKTFKTDAIINV